MDHFFIISTLLSLAINVLVYLQVKNATFFNKKGAADSEKNLIAMRECKVFESLSRVHNIKFARAQCREIHFFFAKLFSKFFFNQSVEEKVHISLHLFSNFLSAIFLYLFLKNFFLNSELAFIVTLIFIFSVWPYQISIYWGHIIFSTMWFYLSIFLTTLISVDMGIIKLIEITAYIGLSCAACYFSSSASRKYPPIIFLFYLIALSKANLIQLENLINNKNILYFVFVVIFFYFISNRFNLFLIKIINLFSNQDLKNSLKKNS